MSESPRRILVFGVSGQDGSYLARSLLDKGYHVIGTTRAAGGDAPANHRRLGIAGRVQLVTVEPSRPDSVSEAVRAADPDRIYFLAAQSSVAQSFISPLETLQSVFAGTCNVLESVRKHRPDCRMFFAASGDCFGESVQPASEASPFGPRSPYGAARCAAALAVRAYRDSYGLHACNGFAFPHESPLRPAHFVLQKIAIGAAGIAAGRQAQLELGALDVVRDWGWAPEYVEAMQDATEHPAPGDYVLATGRSVSLREMVARAFRHFGLEWQEWVRSKPELMRPSDIRVSRADPSRAEHVLGWRAVVGPEEVMDRLCAAGAEG